MDINLLDAAVTEYRHLSGQMDRQRALAHVVQRFGIDGDTIMARFDMQNQAAYIEEVEAWERTVKERLAR